MPFIRENGFYWLKEKHHEYIELTIAEWSYNKWYFILDDIGRDEDEVITDYEIGERIQPPITWVTP